MPPSHTQPEAVAPTETSSVCDNLSSATPGWETSGGFRMQGTIVDTRLGGQSRYFIEPPEDFDMRVPDEVQKCVVYLGVERARDENTIHLVLAGSGFFVSLEQDGRTFVYLVTARHVVTGTGGKPLVIRVNDRDGKAQAYPCPDRWVFHPNSDVDVAVFPWAPPDKIDFATIPYAMLLGNALRTARKIGAGDEVFVTGIFAQFTGGARNFPIVRTGNIALIPDERIRTDFGLVEACAIDVRLSAGFSGSPVFVHETRKSQLGFIPGDFFCLGLVHGFWNDSVTTAGVSANAGLSLVIPAEKIVECLNQDAIAQQRLEVIAARALQNPGPPASTQD